jgi:hypothetical protein
VIDFRVWLLDDIAQKTDVEGRGKKKKYWLTVNHGPDQGQWLFKVGRPSALENITEVLAAYLATQLGINYATYRLAKFEGLDGVASKLIGIESSGSYSRRCE